MSTENETMETAPDTAPETAPAAPAAAPETAPTDDAAAPETALEQHACPDCGKTYTAKSNMLRHRKTAHGYMGPRSKPAEATTNDAPEQTPAEQPEQPAAPKLVATRKPQSAADAEKGRAANKAGLARKIKTADVLDAFILRPFLPPELAQWEREMLEQGGVDSVEVPQIVYLAALTLAIVVPRAQAAFSRYKEEKSKRQLDAQQHLARQRAIEAQAAAEREAATARATPPAAAGGEKPVDSAPAAGQTAKPGPNMAPQFEA